MQWLAVSLFVAGFFLMIGAFLYVQEHPKWVRVGRKVYLEKSLLDGSHFGALALACLGAFMMVLVIAQKAVQL